MSDSMKARVALAERLRSQRVTVDLSSVAEVIRAYYPEVAWKRLKETDKYPRGFRKLALEKNPKRLHKDPDVLAKAIKASVLQRTLRPYEGLKLIDISTEYTKSVAQSLLALSGEYVEEVYEKIPALKSYSRVKARLHAISKLKPTIVSKLAEICDKGEFFSEAIELLSEGFVREALETLINTLRETDNVDGLKVILSHKEEYPELVLRAFERIVTKREAIEKLLDSLGRTYEELFRLFVDLGRPPESERMKELLRERREEARNVVKKNNACPRDRLKLAGKCSELFDEALTIAFKTSTCPAKKAVECLDDVKRVPSLIEHYGCVALKLAIERFGIRRELLELIVDRCPSAASVAIERLSEKDLRDEYVLARIERLVNVVSSLVISKLARLLVQAWAGTGDERVERLILAISKKAGLDEELPELLAILYGGLKDREKFKAFPTQALLKLIDRATPEIAEKILERALEEGLYIPISALIKASKLGVSDEKLLEVSERLPIHTTIAFRGRLAIKRRDFEMRNEFLEKSAGYGLDIPEILLEELAEAYARDQKYYVFLTSLLRRSEVKKLALKVGERLKASGYQELIERLGEIVHRWKPAPEAFKALGMLFEGTENPRAVKALRSWSMEALPIEALEALKAMRMIHPKVVEEERFMERFTPTLARASLSPGGYGAIGILTAIYEGIEKIVR